MMDPGVLRTIARYSSQGLLNGLWQGTVLAGFVGVVLKRNRKLNSSTRFFTCFVLMLAIALLPAAAFHPAASGGTAGLSSALDLPETWSVVFFAAWGAVSLFLLLRLGFGYLALRRLVSRSELLEAVPAKLLAELGGDLSSVSLHESFEITRPMTTGLLRPVILLPGGLAESIGEQELRQILLHELTHVRRYDNWTNLLQRVLAAIFFFYPAVWWIGRELSLQREIACDDAVVAASSTPRVYAQCLARLAEGNWMRGYHLAQSAVGKLCQLTLRIGKILDSGRDVSSRISRVAVAGMAMVTVATVVAASHLPSLVMFAPEAQLSARSAPGAPPVLAKTASAPAVKAFRPVLTAARTKHMKPLIQLARVQSDEARVIAAWLQDSGLRAVPASVSLSEDMSVAVVQVDRTIVTKDGRILVGRYVFVVHYPTSRKWGRVVKS